MSKDLSSDKQSDKYFDAKNIRILATDQKSSFAVTNEAGNEFVFSIPSPVFDFVNTQIDYTVGTTQKSLNYKTNSSTIPRCELEELYIDLVANPNEAKVSGTQIIIGTKDLRDSALIITTDNNGFDCFWELTGVNSGNFDLELRYMSNLRLSSQNLVQILYNYENSIIQKVYFADGDNQLRFFNLRQSVENGDSLDLVDLPRTVIDTVSELDLSQIRIKSIVSGGSHTAGMIQYAYGLYILNGSQTTISPLSELKPLDKGDGLGGGKVNEVLGRSVNIVIPNVDPTFTHIKIYSIKYTAYNQAPEILSIVDKEIDNFDMLTYTDDGTGGTSVSQEEFTFLGSNPIVPRHIATKDNRLFPINIKESNFDVDLDCRAYSFSSGGSCVVMDNASLNENGSISAINTTISSNTFFLPENHDAINKDYDTYKYQSDGTTLGASGKYVEVEIVQASMTDDEAKDLQFFKDRELYRIGIKFYNKRGQTSEPKWVMDLKAPSGNLEGDYNQLRVTLTDEFNTWLADSSNFDTEDSIPIGYKIIRADRTLADQTILTQGMINPTIANYVHRGKDVSFSQRKFMVEDQWSTKMPSIVRVFETVTPFVACKDYHELCWKEVSNNSFDQLGASRTREGYKAASSSDWRAQNLQCNRLMQMFSPETTFRDFQIDASFKLRVLGLAESSATKNWGTETNPTSQNNSVEAKFENGINSSTSGVTVQQITSNPSFLYDKGFHGPTNSDHNRAMSQVYREFNGTFHPASVIKQYEIYGSPEVTNTGADYTNYNNDERFKYCNHLKTMLIDDFDNSDHVNNDAEVQIKGTNSNGAKCITFVEGSDEYDDSLASRKSIEQMYQAANIAETNGVLIAEFSKDDKQLYVGSFYGGMSNESKSNATYIEIGSYTEISNSTVLIESPGDTFVNTYTFTKLVSDDTDIASQAYNVTTEIVSVRVESSVDLKNRNDLSLTQWDNSWQPKYNEYQEYNRVYSQQPKLNLSVNVGLKFKKIQEFDTRIMASKEKIPGEYIDSWTDFLENESKDLDGKFGPINGVVNMKDEIFTLQDSGVAHIAINPRAQVVSNDGVALELGTGGIIHDYKYISTSSGSLNKWGVVTTDNAFYFTDLIKKSIMSCNGSQVVSLSDAEGFHSEMINNLNYDDLVLDNPVLGTGMSVGYSSVNEDVYFSFLQSTNPFTLGFNKKAGAFVSYYDYIPAWYINKGDKMITSDPTHNQVWEHFKGSPNHFYGQHFKSSITLHVAPQGNEIILNGASYKLELTDSNGTELPQKGLTGIRVYNDYQDSGVKTITMRKNVYKKFRNWSLKFPRNYDSRDRLRSAWGFAEFSFENEDGNRLILHDITIFYTQH